MQSFFPRQILLSFLVIFNFFLLRMTLQTHVQGIMAKHSKSALIFCLIDAIYHTPVWLCQEPDSNYLNVIIKLMIHLNCFFFLQVVMIKLASGIFSCNFCCCCTFFSLSCYDWFVNNCKLYLRFYSDKHDIGFYLDIPFIFILFHRFINFVTS